jgi:acyl-CoA thioesterase-1
MWGFALVLAGIVAAGAGVRVALERPRPLNLAGMLLAPVGLGIALLGVGRMLSPVFFGRSAGPRAVLRIMPAGDSLTEGSTGATKDTGGYRGPLWVRLAERSVDFVGAERGGPFAIDRDHESWENITVDDLAARLLADLPVYAPDVILLHVGINDLVAGASPEVVAGRLGALIDGVVARAPRTRLEVGSLAGVRADNRYRVRPDSVTAANTLLRAAVEARTAHGENVHFVDFHARVGRAGADFADDGLHLSQRGYNQMAEVWLEALRRHP